ncbi:unnamed protein product [Brassica rapa subsp. trilocularis]|nr:unnamed protein product [Brassica napus]
MYILFKFYQNIFTSRKPFLISQNFQAKKKNMAESKKIFIVFVICLLCTLLVSVSGIQVKPSCTTSIECELVCFRRTGRRDGVCEGGMCACLSPKPKTELTKTILCKKDRDCPSSSECPKDFYYSCLHGECTCIAV